MSHFLILPKKHSFQQPTSNLQNHLLKTASSTTRLLQELISHKPPLLAAASPSLSLETRKNGGERLLKALRQFGLAGSQLNFL